MPRFTIRRKGMILGTYEGADEDGALDACTKDYHPDAAGFKEHCKQTGQKRDHYTVEDADAPVKE